MADWQNGSGTHLARLIVWVWTPLYVTMQPNFSLRRWRARCRYVWTRLKSTSSFVHLQVSTLLARFLYKRSTGNEPGSDIKADCETVSHLLYCMLISPQCELFKEVLDSTDNIKKLGNNLHQPSVAYLHHTIPTLIGIGKEWVRRFFFTLTVNVTVFVSSTFDLF